MANKNSTRRMFVSVLSVTALSSQTPEELQEEFARLVTDFLIAWNDVSTAILRRVPDVKKAEAFERAYERMVAHPGWTRIRRRK